MINIVVGFSFGQLHCMYELMTLDMMWNKERKKTKSQSNPVAAAAVVAVAVVAVIMNMLEPHSFCLL